MNVAKDSSVRLSIAGADCTGDVALMWKLIIQQGKGRQSSMAPRALSGVVSIGQVPVNI